MEAHDVMTPDVVFVGPDMPVTDVARLLVENRISAVPVLKDGRLIGIVSEGDLFRRAELGTERHRSHWLDMFASGTALASEYVKSRGQTAEDVMTRDVVTVAPHTAVRDIADTLETRHIKRVPVLDGDRLVGIVSRANLIQALAMQPATASATAPTSDRAIRDALFKEMAQQKWAFSPTSSNVTVENGVVYLWGAVLSDAQREAMIVAARAIPGVRGVEDRMMEVPVYPVI